ncbi:MAG: AAA family ATPase, partial [Spirochaetales bacterium]|nr:AAA family ATPase [Spirochaetales bacterium]MCF7939207.1 AAA family ATPase [Spirochaetales bacterium]
VSAYTNRRYAFQRLANEPGRPFIALIGPRGVGKTVLLRQVRALYSDAIYISADTLDGDTSIKEVIFYLYESMGINRFFIDEIHFIPEYAGALKELYDFHAVNIWFTSSVALSLYTSGWDLSRRVRILRLEPFSLREYLAFRYDIDLEALPLKTVFEDTIPASYLRLFSYFKEYVKGGLYPFLLEAGSDFEQFTSIKEKIIHDDIPNFDRSMNIEDVSNIEKVFSFIGKSPIDGMNYSSVANNTGITKYKAEKYLGLLEQSFLLSIAFPKGTNVLKEPKIFMELPYRLLFRAYDECVEELREDFFALAMKQHKTNFSYLKTNRGQKTPDFLLDGKGIDGSNRSFVLEVGGKGKGRSRFKGVSYERKIVVFHQRGKMPVSTTTPGYSPGERVPLHTLGFPDSSQYIL